MRAFVQVNTPGVFVLRSDVCCVLELLSGVFEMLFRRNGFEFTLRFRAVELVLSAVLTAVETRAHATNNSTEISEYVVLCVFMYTCRYISYLCVRVRLML